MLTYSLIYAGSSYTHTHTHTGRTAGVIHPSVQCISLRTRGECAVCDGSSEDRALCLMMGIPQTGGPTGSSRRTVLVMRSVDRWPRGDGDGELLEAATGGLPEEVALGDA